MADAEGPIEHELATLRVSEMRRYQEGNPPPFDLASRDRVCLLLAAVGRERIEAQRPLLLRLLRHSSPEIVMASTNALFDLGEDLDPSTLHHDDLLSAIGALLLVLGSTATFDRISTCFNPSHPRRWEITSAALYALFRAGRPAGTRHLADDPRWIALAVDAEHETAELRRQEHGEPTDADRGNRALRSMLQDLLKLAPKDPVREARKRAAKSG